MLAWLLTGVREVEVGDTARLLGPDQFTSSDGRHARAHRPGQQPVVTTATQRSEHPRAAHRPYGCGERCCKWRWHRQCHWRWSRPGPRPAGTGWWATRSRWCTAAVLDWAAVSVHTGYTGYTCAGWHGAPALSWDRGELLHWRQRGRQIW